MYLRVGILLGLCLTLMACGSRLNPLNWFGGGERLPEVEATAEPTATDPRFLAAEVVNLSIEPLPSGAIVTATALPTRQGYFEPELVEIERTEDRITYEFRVQPPPGETPVGNATSRQVIAAADLSNQDLAGLREIVVQGATNRLISRR